MEENRRTDFKNIHVTPILKGNILPKDLCDLVSSCVFNRVRCQTCSLCSEVSIELAAELLKTDYTVHDIVTNMKMVILLGE